MADQNGNTRGAFVLKGEQLYIANDGHPFDRTGVLALCTPNLSGKSDDIPDVLEKTLDPDWIEALCQRGIETLVKDPRNIRSIFKGEQGTSLAYSGRWILELLQNIDDAIGPRNQAKYIGTKGLGFLSVLQIAENPEVFSGLFNFCFSRERTREALSRAGIAQKHLEDVPNFFVPWLASPDSEAKRLLKDGYQTVIKLKIKNDYRDDVVAQLIDLDPYFLLFSNNITDLTVSVDGAVAEYQRLLKPISSNGHREKCEIKISAARIDSSYCEEEWVRWARVWESSELLQKRSSCMFCLPKRGNSCVPHSEVTNVYNFYPTEEASEVKGFMHLSFDLTPNRKELVMLGADTDKDLRWASEKTLKDNHRLVDETRSLILEDVIDDAEVPVETALDVFVSLNQFSDEEIRKGSPLRKVQIELAKSIKTHPFVPRFGGGKQPIEGLVLWKHDFIDCLVESEVIQGLGLAAKESKPYFHLLEDYDVEALKFRTATQILAENEIKNRTKADRTAISEWVATYLARDYNYLADNLTNLPEVRFLTDSNDDIVSLSDHRFVEKDVFCPNFFDVRALSDSSTEDLQRILKDEEILGHKSVHDELEDLIGEYVISSPSGLLKFEFGKLVEDSAEDFWERHGYRALHFAYSIFKKEPEAFNEIIEEERLHFCVPGAGSGDWLNVLQAFFHPSWLNSRALELWMHEHGLNDEFELEDKGTFLERFHPVKPTKKRGKKAKKQSKTVLKKDEKQVKEFLSLLGVREVPAYRRLDGQGIKSLMSQEPNYRALINEQFYWLHRDFRIDGLGMYLSDLEFNESWSLVNKLLVDSDNFPSRYRKKGSATGIYEQLREHVNFGCYQLCKTSWLKMTPSPLNPSGFFSPSECFLSEGTDDIFPTISKSLIGKILGKEAGERCIAKLRLKENFAPSPDVWAVWLENFSKGFASLLSEHSSPELLNAQTDAFFKAFIDAPIEYFHLNTDVALPVRAAHSGDIAYEFLAPSDVLINDTSISDQLLAQELSAFGVGIFPLGRGDVAPRKISERLSLSSVSDIFSISPVFDEQDQLFQDEQLQWLEHRWDILGALNQEFADAEAEEMSFDEFKSKVVFCSNLQLSISKGDQAGLQGPSFLASAYYEETSGARKTPSRIYIADDEHKDNLVKYLCLQLFCWKGKTALVKSLISQPIGLDKIREILEENGLSSKLVDNFRALKERAVKTTSMVAIKPNEKSSDPNFEVGAIVKAGSGDLPNYKDPEPNGKSEETSGRESSVKPSASSSRSTLNKNLSRQSSSQDTKPNKERSGNNQRSGGSKNRVSFGRRSSGHLRPRKGAEIVTRSYFDDEDETNPSNKRIGDEAEHLVLRRIEEEIRPQQIDLLGGNNKGYDIEYKLNGVIHFVEVKGLSGSWDDNDVLLSKSQFEKAQQAKDLFSIFVVEFVDDHERTQVWEIKNPAEYFTKMQVDHGWRNFAKSHNRLEPRPGRYLVVDGDSGGGRKIESVQSHGRLIRVSVEGSPTPYTFSPNTMSIEER